MVHEGNFYVSYIKANRSRNRTPRPATATATSTAAVTVITTTAPVVDRYVGTSVTLCNSHLLVRICLEDTDDEILHLLREVEYPIRVLSSQLVPLIYADVPSVLKTSRRYRH